MANRKEKAELIHNLYLKLNGKTRQRWETVNAEGHDFYLDNQLSAKEKEALEDNGQPTFTINRIIPIIEMLNFYATANDPKWQAVATEGSDSKIAALHNDIADYIWYISDGKQMIHQVINDACTKSVGYIQVYVDPNADQGMGEVKLRGLEPFDVFVDPQSRDPLYRDAAFMMVHKIIPRAQLEVEFPESKSKIKKANSQYPSHYSFSQKADERDFQYKDISENFSILGEDDTLIDYYELYEKITIPYIHVFYTVEPSADELKELEVQVTEQITAEAEENKVKFAEQAGQLQVALEQGQIIKERFDLSMQKLEEELLGDFDTKKEMAVQQIIAENTRTEDKIVSEKEFDILMQGELKNKITQKVKYYEKKVRMQVCIGDEMIDEKILPGEDYPIIPMAYKYTGTPYPMSAVAPLVGKQKELNKAHQLMVHNASLGSSLRWVYVDGSIDADYWEKFASAPGALLPINNGYEIPKEVLPAQLSAAFVQMVQEGKGDMEYLAGIYSSQQGDMSAQHDTYKGLLANDEYGTRRVKNWVENNVKACLKQAGLVVRDYAQFIYKAHKVFRIVQPSSIQEQREIEINIPMYNDFGDEIGKYNDYSAARFDIKVVAGNSLPVNRWAYLGELKELMQLGVVDDIAVLAETDVKDKEMIAKRKSLYTELQGKISQLEETVEDQAGTIETLQRKAVDLGIKDKVRQVEHDMRKQVLDSRARLKGDVAVNKAQLDATAKEAKVASKEHKVNLKALENIKKKVAQESNSE
tara:strand:+ start:114 stop:2384 length:2271 start_codon:yes stop_codon:yes gene_type:complete